MVLPALRVRFEFTGAASQRARELELGCGQYEQEPHAVECR